MAAFIQGGLGITIGNHYISSNSTPGTLALSTICTAEDSRSWERFKVSLERHCPSLYLVSSLNTPVLKSRSFLLLSVTAFTQGGLSITNGNHYISSSSTPGTVVLHASPFYVLHSQRIAVGKEVPDLPWELLHTLSCSLQLACATYEVVWTKTEPLISSPPGRLAVCPNQRSLL